MEEDVLATADVLLIEHSTLYSELASQAIRDAHPNASVAVVRTCEEALYYFFRAGTYTSRDDIPPRLILLNVAAPGIGSLEVLERIKRDRLGCMVPIVAMGLGLASDLSAHFCSRGANSFVNVPFEPDEYLALLRQVIRYWLDVNVSPRRSSGASSRMRAKRTP